MFNAILIELINCVVASGTAGRDFGFGFRGNYMGGMNSVSGSLGTFNPYSAIMEGYVDGIVINMNIQFNNIHE